ncbi:B3 domain-containing protein [Hordeum vulgare]|nr:B3 domain-containing protein [Hordeum vulgare]
MSNSCQCCKRYWTHLHGKVRCFVTHMDRHSRHRMVIPERFVNYFAWKLSAAIELEAPNGNVYDVGITERRNKTLLRSGWEAFVDDNHIVEGDSLMFRYCGNCCFKVVVFDSSGCEKVVSCARSRRQININDQEPSTNSADISTSFNDGSTHSSARGRSVDWQSGTLGHCRKRARTDAISSPSDDFSAEDSPYEHESSESDDQMLATPLYVLSGKCYVTEEDEANIVELVREIQPEMPLLVAMMMKPSLKPYPDLVIPKDYALAHFPRKNQTIKLQLPEQSNKWHCEFRVKSDGGRCNLKECGFVRDNNLLEGDLCVFQPMTNQTFSSGYEDHRISERYKDISCDLPYMMPMGAHLTDVQEKIVLEKVGAIASDLHIYVAVMTKTNVRVALVSLTFATQYAVKYLQNGSRSFVLQLEGKSQRWHGEMRDKKGALRISGGWTSFASDNGLREGDICLFELMKNKGGLKKMTVYIICRKLLV